MDAQDRLALGQQVLDGDRDAKKILADLLEEQGERGLAQWARGCGGRGVQRLNLVLMLLPCRAALRLGTNFFEHVLSRYTDPERRQAEQFVGQLHKWIDDKWPNGEIVALRLPAPERMLDNYQIDAWSRLYDATRLLIEATENAVRGEMFDPLAGGSPSHWQAQSKLNIRYVAEWARTAGLRREMWTRVKDRSHPIIMWQLAHTKAALDHLLHPQEIPWPK